jgi:4-diphosphocytidyl-2-C-methyl-D-erythritol kinase
MRALQLMRDKTGRQMFFDANLFKNCPAQAGLGGGSANAATAMFGCNELMGKPARQDEVRRR